MLWNPTLAHSTNKSAQGWEFRPDLVRIHNYRDSIRGVAREVVAITRITGSDGPCSRGRELQLASSVSGRWTDRARARLASAGDHRDGALRFE